MNVGDYISPTMILGICVEENQEDEFDLKSLHKGRIIELAKTKAILSRTDILLVIDVT